MKYRLTIHPDMDNSIDSCKEFLFDSKVELDAALNTVADILIFLQDDLKAMTDTSNMFISEELVNGEWVES